MPVFDQWHDWARLVIFFVCLTSIIILIKRFRLNRNGWNSKTRDYWYSLVMWSLAGCVITVEGVYQDSDFGFRGVFVIAASLITLKGLLQKGEWGETEK